MKAVCKLDCHFCVLHEKLGEPQVSPWKGLIWTRWNVRFGGHCFAVSAVSDKPLGNGRSCTCDAEVTWDICSSTEKWEAILEFVDYLTDGEYDFVDRIDAEEAA
jgi:hypothetical protein